MSNEQLAISREWLVAGDEWLEAGGVGIVGEPGGL